MPYPKVLTFTAVFVGKHTSDIQSHIYEECMLLSKRAKLTIITQKIEVEASENLTLVEIPKIFLPGFTSIQRILGYLLSTIKNRKKFDLVFTRTFRNHFLIPGIISKIFLKKKFVMWLAGSGTIRFRKKSFQKYITKLALRVADIIISTSDQLVNELETSVGPIDKTKIRIMNNFTNTLFFKPNEKIPTNNNILSVSRITPTKGIERIIYSLPKVIQEIPDVKFIHVGPIKNKKYWKSLNDLITRLGCEKSIDFKGPIHFEKIPKVYNSSKIFILATKSEGQSLVTAEAMSCGKPVIVTPVGGIPSFVKNEINGFLLKNADDSDEIAKTIIRLLKDDKLREKIGASARKSMEEFSSKESYENQLTDIFDKLLAN